MAGMSTLLSMAVFHLGNPDPSPVLNIPFNLVRVSIAQAVHDFFQASAIDYNNCPQCKQPRDATQQMFLEYAPRGVVVQIIRQEDYNLPDKRTDPFDLGGNITLPVIGEDLEMQLCSVVEHIGGHQHDGHFQTYVLNDNK